jgi:hypothetical protein
MRPINKTIFLFTPSKPFTQPMERFFTITMNGRPMQIPLAGTTITTSASATPRTWVKLSVNGRITDAFLIDQAYEEAISRRDQARTAVLCAA